jgi:hypothetical protein
MVSSNGCGLNILCSTAALRPKLIDLLPELRPASDGLCERAQAEHDAGALGLPGFRGQYT